VIFVIFVILGVVRRRRTGTPSCRRIVVSSCKREAQPCRRLALEQAA
jgi:hypothetical protein